MPSRQHPLSQWRSLDRVAKGAFLQRAAGRRLKAMKSGSAAPDRTGVEVVVDLDGVHDLEGFLCALGEAINGSGGYFGRNLHALQDCLIGGFGPSAPWTLCVRGGPPEAVLGAAALIEVAEAELASLTDDDLLSADIGDWCRAERKAALDGRRDLWRALCEVFQHFGVEVRQTPSAGEAEVGDGSDS